MAARWRCLTQMKVRNRACRCVDGPGRVIAARPSRPEPTMQLALFDFDHTITTCDSYSRFLRRVATPEQRAQAWWRIGPWLLAYRLKLISAARIRRRVTAQVFSGRHAGEIGQLARDYAREHLPGMVRPQMLEQIRWHKAQGHTVAVVSASIDLYLQHWCEQLG